MTPVAIPLVPIQDCPHRPAYCGWPEECPAKCSRKEFFDEYENDGMVNSSEEE